MNVPSWISTRTTPAELAQAQRLLAGGRVEGMVWFRGGLAGTVVAPNGRTFAAWLVLDREHLREVHCACAPRPLKVLCSHLVALLFAALRRHGGLAEKLPGQRFEDSLWFRAAEGLHHGPGGGSSLWNLQSGGARLELVGTHGELGGWIQGDGGPWQSLCAGPFPSAAVRRTVSEERLRSAALGADERALAALGRSSARRSLEDSMAWAVAAAAFDAADRELAATVVEVEEGSLWVLARADDAALALRLSGRAVAAWEHRHPGVLVEMGMPLVPGFARKTLRLDLVADGSLSLDPVLLTEYDGRREILPQSVGEARSVGPFFVLDSRPALVRLESGPRPFAEPEAGAQGSFDLDDDYRPSPLGVPLDRRTRVPAGAAAGFLARHRQELSTWPEELYPQLLARGPAAIDRGRLVLRAAPDEDHVDVEIEVGVGPEEVALSNIALARARGQSLWWWRGVVLDPLDAAWAWIDTLPPAQPSGAYRLDRVALCRLRQQLPEALELDGPEPWQELVRGFERRCGPDSPAPESLGLSLFDFQIEGYQWLWFLWRNGFGGLLCDDMGLGKTHQAIALCAAIAAELPRPVRVVVATQASILPHWRAKLAELLPQVALCSRDLALERGVEGVLLVSYGVLRNDASRLAELGPLDLLILDEAQAVKNRDSLTHRELRRLKARMTVGLTGTPIENSLEELRTLLDRVALGYLPAPAAFQRDFADPIAAGSQLARERLARLIRPLVVRRTKAEVLAGLPEKIEDHRRCRLTPGQAELYNEVLATRGASLRAELAGSGPVSYLHVFALLQQLKTICNHPDLLDASAPSTLRGSGKWDLFVELLAEALGSGLKVVVFSQSLSLLDLVARWLDRCGVEFEQLRGSTRERGRPLARFRDDPRCRVFLASLKAGGVGIDLTAASVVIHYDRWWNRAKQDQATDRVHRYGQQRGVQVFSFVCEGTIEERIDEIIEGKAALAADLLPQDGVGLFERLGRDELLGLLEPVAAAATSLGGED